MTEAGEPLSQGSYRLLRPAFGHLIFSLQNMEDKGRVLRKYTRSTPGNNNGFFSWKMNAMPT